VNQRTTSNAGAVTAIDTTTNKVEATMTVRIYPIATAIMPNGKTAHVVDENSDSVTPINVATNNAGKASEVGDNPGAIAICRDHHWLRKPRSTSRTSLSANRSR
jgi:YVTN family beta-propeller protein